MRSRGLTLRRGIESGISIGLLLGTSAALLQAARNNFAPFRAPLTFALVYWQWLSLAGLLAGAAAVALGSIAAPLTGIVRLRGAALAALVTLFWVLILAYNTKAVAALNSQGGPWRYRLLLPWLFALATIGLLLAILPGDRFRPTVRVLTLAVLAGTLGAFYPARPAPVERLPRPSGFRPSGQRVLVVGVDGASWDLMQPLLDRGELPHFAALRARGAWGRLKSLQPTRSALIWTTIATGMDPDRHGIRGFTYKRFRRVQQELPPLRPLKRLGLAKLHGFLLRTREIYDAPIASTVRKVPAFWNIASAYGSPVAVVNWWATWPAEPVLGQIVSERVYIQAAFEGGVNAKVQRLTYPESLYRDVLPLVVGPDQVSYQDTRRFLSLTEEQFEAIRSAPVSSRNDLEANLAYFVSTHETTHRIARYLIDQGKKHLGSPSDLLVLFRIVDMACHTSLTFSELVKHHGDASPEDLLRYGGVVSQAYRQMDQALDDLIAAFGEGNIVVLSDHGWKWVSEGFYWHHQAPDGIFIAAGPAFQAGEYGNLGVQDILPLLVRLKGFPIASDLFGRVPEELFDRQFLESHPQVDIDTYGQREDLAVAESAAAVDNEMLDRLRALGYIE